ncbi:hypothetical protein ACFLVN_01040 [Chloroflexota bacterium]
MDTDSDRIEYAARHTEILRPPRQSLSTFGTTNIHYYMVTEPVYSDLLKDAAETVIREGRVITERPRIVTPYYLSRLEGFSSDASRYFNMLLNVHGPDAPGLFYTYKNEPKEMNIVSEHWKAIVSKLNDEIDKRGDPLASIIKGEDELWDVSLLKFIYEITRGSLRNNLSQLGARGLLDIDSSGVTTDARQRIEELFRQVAMGLREPRELKSELDRWNVFDEYEDRFLTMFKKKR